MNNNKKDDSVIEFLDLALAIEDQMSRDVYGEYLGRKIWPEELEDEVFEAITTSLMILIKETEEHRLAFLSLYDKSR